MTTTPEHRQEVVDALREALRAFVELGMQDLLAAAPTAAATVAELFESKQADIRIIARLDPFRVVVQAVAGGGALPINIFALEPGDVIRTDLH